MTDGTVRQLCHDALYRFWIIWNEPWTAAENSSDTALKEGVRNGADRQMTVMLSPSGASTSIDRAGRAL